MAGIKRVRWGIMPILLFGLFGGLVLASNPINANAVDQVEGEIEAWMQIGLDLVTVDPFHAVGESIYAFSGKSPASANAECALEPTEMISRWPLNESDGATRFADKVGGHHGRCEGEACPSAVKGITGGAFKFTASEENEIRVPPSTDFDWLKEDSFSISVWVKTTQDCSGNKVFIGRYFWGEGTWWVGCTPDPSDPTIGLAVFRLRDDTLVPRQVNGTSRINDGHWHNIVSVRNGKDDDNLLYVDGKLENTSSSREYAGDFINTQDVTIGGYDEPRDYYLEGSLDEIVIFDRVLTTKEIQTYYYTCDPPEIFLPVITK